MLSNLRQDPEYMKSSSHYPSHGRGVRLWIVTPSLYVQSKYVCLSDIVSLDEKTSVFKQRHKRNSSRHWSQNGSKLCFYSISCVPLEAGAKEISSVVHRPISGNPCKVGPGSPPEGSLSLKAILMFFFVRKRQKVLFSLHDSIWYQSPFPTFLHGVYNKTDSRFPHDDYVKSQVYAAHHSIKQ